MHAATSGSPRSRLDQSGALAPASGFQRLAVESIVRALADHRPSPSPQSEYAGRSLGLDPSVEDSWRELNVRSTRTTSTLTTLLCVVLTNDAKEYGIEPHNPDEVHEGPSRTTLQLSDGWIEHYDGLLGVWPAGSLHREPVAVRVSTARGVLSVWSRSRTATRDVQEQLLGRARSQENPLHRNHLVAPVCDGDVELHARAFPEANRDQISLPEVVWTSVDRNVHRHFQRVEQLRRLGLGARRGLLLTGPPGTGKTHLCRILAREVADVATTILPSREAMESHLEEVYVHASRLAPSVVFLEDVDVIARERKGAPTGALQSLLSALDGIQQDDAAVVTVATTNEADALDPAAVRAARFDRIVEVPLPDFEGRCKILTSYAASLGLGSTIDVERLARLTAGASGADLRELFRCALLTRDGDVTTGALLSAANEEGYIDDAAHGTYL